VTRDEKTHLYQLGPALISLGMAATHNVRLQDAAPPVLRKLSAMTKGDTFLVILAGFKGLVLEKVEGPNNLELKSICTAEQFENRFLPTSRIPLSMISSSMDSAGTQTIQSPIRKR
jgi:hypothetical protein